MELTMSTKRKSTSILERLREHLRELLGPLLSPDKLAPKLVPVRRNTPARRRKS